MRHLIFIGFVILLLFSCGNETSTETPHRASPIVSDNGLKITFPEASHLQYFKTENLESETDASTFSVPAHVAATILTSKEGSHQNVILFENPELASHFTQLNQLQIDIDQISNINLKQRRSMLERTKDLNSHGVATGQELLDAEEALAIEKSELSNRKAALIEHESQLLSHGFSPKSLRKAKPESVLLICDIPESQIANIDEGNSCEVVFSAFPNSTFSGKVEAIAAVVDYNTRMVKARINVDKGSKKIKSGMYAQVTFDLESTDHLSVNKNALITVQGKHYVFVKTADNEFERRPVSIGQEIGDRIIIYEGISSTDEVAIEGVMQLKGLSFGY